MEPDTLFPNGKGVAIHDRSEALEFDGHRRGKGYQDRESRQ